MNRLSIVRALGVAVVVLAAVCACSGAGSAGGAQSALSGAVPGVGIAANVARPAGGGAHHASISPGTCGSTPGPNSFVGGKDGNHAPGTSAGVLSGAFNLACDQSSAVVAGALNAVSSGGSHVDAADAMIGAGEFNVIAGSSAAYSFIGGGYGNGISSSDGPAAIVAGQNNTLSGNVQYSMIGAGLGNTISNGNSFIGGGNSNTVAGFYSVVGGGHDNNDQGAQAFIGSGEDNAISSSATYGVISGGSHNSTSAEYSGVAGGENNTASGEYSTIAGGSGNTASGTESTVAGGGSSTASGYASFAAGYHANASEAGSFVWSDNSSSNATSPTVAGEFVARASGGVEFFSNAAMTTGVKLAAGGGSWSSLSDRAVKTNVEAIDDAQILDKVASMPITRWSYISEHGVRHLGPMAQDFYAAFGIGEDDRHITSIDEDGVALAAIKALNHRLAARNAALLSRLAQDERRLARLEARMASVR
ncbi:MAG: tail fiber domain-containing protein [Candidatus Eremiobacteraeota bacterium]|nr:tail fiber domain-containing protein [Candidatus Eremiobacteraeota bacterium]